MASFDLIKKMLKGSTTMPMGAAGESNVHYHDGVACTHDHSHDHAHEHHHHEDGSCCDHDHSKD